MQCIERLCKLFKQIKACFDTLTIVPNKQIQNIMSILARYAQKSKSKFEKTLSTLVES